MNPSGLYLIQGSPEQAGLPTKAEATDAFDKLMASKSGSASTVFAFQATPVMSFGVSNLKEINQQ
jgi:hypothetical protein